MASGPITSWQMDGETMETVTDFIFLDSKIRADGDHSHENKRLDLLGRKADKPRQCIKKQRHYFVVRGPSSQSYGFSSSHVWMWKLDHKEGWVPKNWCFELWCWRRLLRVPWTARRSNQSILKEIKLLIRRTDAEAEAPLLCPPDAKNWRIGKDPAAGKDWRQDEKGTTEDEMIGWQNWFNGHEFEQAPGASEGQGSLACCSAWRCRVGHDWAAEQQKEC